MTRHFDALGLFLRASMALMAIASAVSAGVLLVDPASDPDAAFDAAVAAASDGDTLVLLPGDYQQPWKWIRGTIVGKGLTIVPAAGAQPVFQWLWVKDLPPGSQLVLRGVDLDQATSGDVPDGGAVQLDNCAGSVWIEDCTVVPMDQLPGGPLFSFPYYGWTGVRMSGCAAVTLVRCSLLGGKGAPEWFDEFGHYAFATRGGHGASVLSSKAMFHDCTLQGGVGGVGQVSATGGAEGGSGLNVVDGTALLAGSTATGGAKALKSKEPGDGVHAAGSSSVWLRGSTATAGTGTPAAQDIDAPPGAVETFAAPPRSLEISSPLHEGEAGTLVIGGQPSDLTAIFVSFKGAAQFLPGKQGAFVLGSPLFGPLLLAVNPSPTGEWTLPFSIASLNPPSLTEQTFLLQLAVHDGSQVLLEGGTSLTLLDASVP